MTRELLKTSIAAALAVGTTFVAPCVTEAASPRAATATVSVKVTVPSTAVISATTNAATSAWTGASQAVPFTVTVASKDTSGYTFSFAGANSVTSFALAGIDDKTTTVPYTITDSTHTYTYGATGPIHSDAGVATFNVNLKRMANVTPDTYTDTITVIVNPL